jgi:pilus assembly protein CpaC
MKTALQILEQSNYMDAATELRRKIMEIEIAHLSQRLEEQSATIAKLRAELENLRPSGTSPQVMLSFHVLECSKTKLRDLGFKADLHEVLGLKGEDRDVGFHLMDATKAVGLLHALSGNGVARILAEPTLVTISGREATYHSGGEVPVMVPQGGSATSCEFKPYGTMVHATPTLLQDGKLRLSFHVRISELDRSLDVKLAEQTIPGFRTRQLTTTVVMEKGQSFLLRGLTQKRAEASLGEDGKITERTNELESLVVVIPEIQQ